MRVQLLFLLLYSGVLNIGILCAAQQNELCVSGDGVTQLNCTAPTDPTADFLMCVGVPEGPGAGDLHILNLKGLMDAVLDVYSFMSSSLSGVPVLELFGTVRVSWTSLLQNQDFIQFWLQARLTPLISSVSQQFLTCLSNSNFDCSTYHTVVQQLSQHYSGLDPVRQKWIYMFFMYPFLSRNSSAGCVDPNGTSEDWLMKNFGSFSVHGQIRDFTSINLFFSGLEALNLLTPEQQAELLLNPELAGLDNSSLSIVMNNLMNSVILPGGGVTQKPNGSLWTTALPSIYVPSPQDPVTEVMNGFMTAFKPVGSFVREFVSLSHQPDLSSATFVQAMLNWTLAELAAPYKNSTSSSTDPIVFDPTDVNGWFTHVVTPVLRRFLPGDIPSDLITVFYSLFYINAGTDENTEAPDLCRITLEEPECALNNLMEHVVKVLHCADTVNLTFTPQTFESLTLHLTTSLNSLLNQLTKTNFSGPDSPFSDILRRVHKLSPNNLQDELFISMWFQIKLKPLLSHLDRDYLSCLSKKPFSCQTYQILVKGMSDNMFLIGEDARLVYQYFIFSFLLHKNTTAPCMANSSSEWILLNLGGFSPLASVWEMYQLNGEFSALDALDALTPRQIAELVVEDLPVLPNKKQVIDAVFDFALTSPIERNLTEILHHIVIFAKQMGMNCSSYQQIVKRLYTAVVPPEMKQIVQDTIDTLSLISPRDCLLSSAAACFSIPVNESLICAGVYSNELFQPLMNDSCNTGLYQITCSQEVTGLTAEDLANLLSCSLSSNITYSKEIWKLLFTKRDDVLDEALIIFSSRALYPPINSASLSNMLDAVADVRLEKFSPDRWDVVFLANLMDNGMKPFLPFTSGNLLSCISSKNFSCQAYQFIVKEFSDQFFLLDEAERLRVLKYFILPYLNKTSTDPGCVSTTNSSVEWLLMDLGPFAEFLTVRDLISINPRFNPLEVLPYLTVNAIMELLVFDDPLFPPRDVVINAVFDFLTVSPWEHRLPDVLSALTSAVDRLHLNISCSSYRIMFHRLDYLFPNVPMDMESVIVQSKSVLLKNLPAGCVIYDGQCSATLANETTVCRNVTSSVLMDSLRNDSLLCSVNITQYACAQLTGMLPEDLVKVLSCNLHGNSTVSDETWKLFITKVNPILGPALDLFTNTTLPWSRPLVSVLDMIGEVTLSQFSSSNYRNSSFIQRWFQTRLRHFLPYASPHFLSCLAGEDFSCDSFQSVIQIFSQQFDAISHDTAISIYVDFIQVFLSLNRTAGCTAGVQSSDWLSRYFGPFSAFASLPDLQRMNPSFQPLDVLDKLSLGQLVQVVTSPGLLNTSAQVNLLMNKVPDSQFYLFFTSLATALQGVVLPSPVQKALLLQVLNRANLSDPAVPDSQVQVWIGTNLPPLISAITPEQIPQYFTIMQNRPCSISQQAVALLNTSSSSFSADTLQLIYTEIISSLKGPEPLRCYGNQSFYSFLQLSFLSFRFPPLSVLLTLMPADRRPQLLSTISPAELYSFLSQPGAVDDLTQLCQIFNNYQSTGEYLQNEPVVSAAVGRQTLGCVWSRALSVSSQAEVDQWFNVRLVRYLPFLSSQLISSTQLSGASCLSFSKFVSVLGTYNYSGADFTQKDIYNTIRDYLSTGSTPKCYNSADPVLNSTSWFVNYIGLFVSFISVDDLDTFGGTQLEVFTADTKNLELFQHFNISEDVISVYVELLYELNPSFSATLLPPLFRCFAPASAFTQFNSTEAMLIVESLQDFCSSIDPTVSAALAKNMGSVTASSILALGNSSTGLSTGQLSSTNPSVLNSSLSVLSSVVGWNQAQTMAIIQVLLKSGVFKITGSSSLLQLGTLVTGIPSTVYTSILPAELLKAFQSQTFLTSITTAPSIAQQTIVNQILYLNSSSDSVVSNIPGSLATRIPRNSLLTLSASSAAMVNQKQWKYEQAMLFFDTVAGAILDASDISEDSISPQVLQGFTSTRIQYFDSVKVRKLIRGCRRRGNVRVVLQESQLTCMYNYIKNDIVTVFTDYPPELLLYYDYSLVNQSLCQDFFSALGYADFSVLSSTLSFRKQILLSSAIQCLRISGSTISRAQLDVLGNMTCMLDSTYIQNSDVYILEKLKQCQDFSADQISAMENVLLNKNTAYGAPANWTLNTLNSLGILPLYLSSSFWAYFTQKDKTQFMKTFLPLMRAMPGLSKQRISSMLTEAQKVSKTKTRLSLRNKRDTACTAGEITQVQANDNSLPFGYDVTQFTACLSVQTLKDNLATISEKATGSDYQRVILDKLNQAYPAGISNEVLQILGPASRAATVTDISKWNITTVDTLSALMKSSDGNWTSEQAKAIVGKYLGVSGNSLGSSELNAIGGANLCALDVSTISTISSASLQSASSLSVSTCSLAQKEALFSIAQTAFSDKALSSTRATSTISSNAYQLIQNYLSGASLAYIQTLAASGISMDLLTFSSLNPSVVNALTVSQVKGLLGSTNLADLKRYENNTVVQNWIRLQLQSDLNTLGIGLTGGRADTSTAATTASSSSTTANANLSGAASTTKPTGSGSRIQALPRLQLLVLLAVVMATLKLMH